LKLKDSTTTGQPNNLIREASTVGPRFNEPLRNEFLGKTNDILLPAMVKCMEKNLETTKLRYSERILVCGLSLHQGSKESRKTLEQQFIFQVGTLNPHVINERFSFN